MTIEVRKLVINASVTDSTENTVPDYQNSRNRTERKRLIHDISREVMKQIRQEWGRR